MTDDQDHYESYYSDKLWDLLPGHYCSLDSDEFHAKGPLRELVDRIGAQAAILRRSLDRLWEDQSIETCDDWVIAYIGDLLATNPVSNLDPRTLRRRVAKTIYYRRRKGTLGLLEEITFDTTGWNVKVVEFFRRLGRTRHGLDPAIGLASKANADTARLQRAESLVGSLTGTSIGGLADFRDTYGASKAGTAFDEYFHTPDFRQGRGQCGWYGITRLGVFLWRLQSFGLDLTTPVESSRCPGHFTFDPTGREVPLFGGAMRSPEGAWSSPDESQLPSPISPRLLQLALGANSTYPLYSEVAEGSLITNPIGIFLADANSGGYELVPVGDVAVGPDLSGRPSSASHPPALFRIDPARGRLFSRPIGARIEPRVTYRYGFSSTIGAGPYDRRIDRTAPPTPIPQKPPITGGVRGLVGSGTIPKSGTVTLGDSLTYTSFPDVQVQGPLTIRADEGQRPVVRLAPTSSGSTQLTFTGTTGAADNSLVLDGLFLSGADIVLAGEFDRVTITCCTLDPGNSATIPISPSASSAASVFAEAIDGRELVPCRLWIEGQIGSLIIERCLAGPIRTRHGGLVGTLVVTDTILQALPTSGDGLFQLLDLNDPLGLETRLKSASDPLGSYLRRLSPALIGSGLASAPFSAPSPRSLLDAINALIAGPSIHDVSAFQEVILSPATLMVLARPAQASAPTPELNRRLLEDAFPIALADAALALTDGDVSLSRSTVLGRVIVHRLQASECILRDPAQVDDTQRGGIRYTAWANGSSLPRQYESLMIMPGAQLFTSTDFGQPGYGQLLPTVDDAIATTAGTAPLVRPTISAGAENGSEMGAFARERHSVKEEALRLKYREYMPVGLVPVLIHVT